MLSSYTAVPGRVEWVDYAKGFCIIMVVMMHSTLGVEEDAGAEGCMHAIVAFAAVPHAGFLPDLGPVPVPRHRPRLADLSRSQGRALRYFYVLWVTIQFAFKAPDFAAQRGGPLWRHLYRARLHRPFGTIWFIYLLPIFFVVAKATRPTAAVRSSGSPERRCKSPKSIPAGR